MVRRKALEEIHQAIKARPVAEAESAAHQVSAVRLVFQVELGIGQRPFLPVEAYIEKLLLNRRVRLGNPGVILFPMAHGHIVGLLPHCIQLPDGASQVAALLCQNAVGFHLAWRKQPQVYGDILPVHAVFIAKFSIIGCGKGVQIGDFVAVFIHIRQRRLENGADTALSAVAGQGGNAADSAHFHLISIEKLGKIRHRKGAEHSLPFKGPPIGHPGLLPGAVLHRLFKGNGKKRIDPLSFLRSRLANDHLFSPPNTGQILFSEADSCSRPLRRTR